MEDIFLRKYFYKNVKITEYLVYSSHWSSLPGRHAVYIMTDRLCWGGGRTGSSPTEINKTHLTITQSLNSLPDFLLMEQVENLWCELRLLDIHCLQVGAVLGHCEQSSIRHR